MAYSAQNYSYQQTPQNSVESVDFSAMQSFAAVAKSLQVGVVSSKTTNSDSFRAPNIFSTNTAASATTQTTSSSADDSVGYNFDASKFGARMDAAKAQAGYEPDADREMATEQKAPSKEIANLQAYQELRANGFSHEDIYAAQTRFGVSNEQMRDNVRDGKDLVPEHEQAAREALTASKQYAKDFQLSMQLPEGKQAKDGVSASMAGVKSTVDVAKMMVA